MKVFDHSKENMYLNGINQILIFYSFCVLLNHLKSKIKNWFIATLKITSEVKKQATLHPLRAANLVPTENVQLHKQHTLSRPRQSPRFSHQPSQNNIATASRRLRLLALPFHQCCSIRTAYFVVPERRVVDFTLWGVSIMITYCAEPHSWLWLWNGRERHMSRWFRLGCFLKRV